MANKEIEIKVPDIGGASGVDVIEILVKVGEELSIDTPLITLESDKASMEIPSPQAGKVSKIKVNVGDKVSEGDIILWIQTSETQEPAETRSEKSSPTLEKSDSRKDTNAPEKSTDSAKAPQTLDVTIPDIGGATDVDVIDVLVKPGMSIDKDQSLITLEGDKATMDIPSPYSGTVKKVSVKLGDKVSQGSLILTMETLDSAKQDSKDNSQPAQHDKTESTPIQTKSESTLTPTSIAPETTSGSVAAGPAVRRMARELGVNLALVQGSGRKTRIIKEDVQAYVKQKLNENSSSGSFSLPSAPTIDFSQFGEIETKSLNKIKKITGVNVHRSWITIPHVTQFDEADITDLESFRQSEIEQAKNSGYKLTLLAFVCKVVSRALQIYPQFNTSLDSNGAQLIYKKYYNIGIAVETPNGLVVPVIKNVDQLSVEQIAQEMARLSAKARDKGLMPADMSGGCFTISSLGGIGGTAFTPIVNGPEVAILGLSRSAMKPIYIEGEFKPRLMLPLSLSYHHRVIDGAEAARFTRFISEALSDLRKILL